MATRPVPGDAEAPRTPDMRAGEASAGANSRRSITVPDSTAVTPHTLAPEAYRDALSREPGLFTIGFHNMDALAPEDAAAAANDPLLESSDSVQDDGSGADAPVRFRTGNPSVQQWRGKVRICRVDAEGSLARDRGKQLCVLAVPTFMTIPDLCRFIGQHMDKVRHLRLVHEESRARYVTLLDMDCQESADAFYIEFNGKPYSSMDTERCVVLFVKDVLFLDHAPAADGSAAAKVCRYTQMPESHQTGGCMHCGEPEDLWMCLICGFMGCGRYRSQHALQHFVDSGHSFAIELVTQRVWDYTGDNYVHRLVANKVDGKLVELPEGDHKGQRKGEEDGKLEEALVGSKLESVLQEYNEMLTRTLDDQRRFFEDRMAAMQQHWEAEIKMLRNELSERDQQLLEHARKAKERKTEEKKVAILSERLKKAWEEAEFHKQCNVSLTENQQALNAKLAEAAKKDEEILDLQDQVRDLMFFLEAQKSVDASDESEDIRNGQIVMQASPAARRRKDKGKSPLNRASSSSSSPAGAAAAGGTTGAEGSPAVPPR